MKQENLCLMRNAAAINQYLLTAQVHHSKATVSVGNKTSSPVERKQGYLKQGF